MRYFKVECDARAAIGTAYVLDEGAGLVFLPDSGDVSDWEAPTLLVLEQTEGGLADYQRNDMALRICSPALRDLIDRHASEDDLLQWLDATIITTQDWTPRPYYVLHFRRQPDVLDKEMTRYGPGGDSVVVPVFASAMVQNHHVFCYPGGGDFRIFVSETVKRAIVENGLTGMTFKLVGTR